MSNIYSGFAKKVIAETYRDGENLIISPYSVLIAMAIAIRGADGKTRRELLDAISEGLSLDELDKELNSLKEATEDRDGISSVNAIAVRPKLKNTIRRGFKKAFSKEFEGELFASNNMVEDINLWAKEKTNGLINDLADKDVDCLAIMNAICFEAEWFNDYRDENVIEGVFNNANGTTSKVTMLHSEEGFYLEDDYFTGFMKWYKNGYSFVGLLPREEGGEYLREGIEQLDLHDVVCDAGCIKTVVNMPEFKMELAHDLKEAFRHWGVQEAFTEDADLGNMSTEDLMVNGVVQKAVVDVNHKGTRAAAASMMYIGAGGCIVLERHVSLNRPFVYAIVDNCTRQPIFAGVVNEI